MGLSSVNDKKIKTIKIHNLNITKQKFIQGIATINGPLWVVPRLRTSANKSKMADGSDIEFCKILKFP